MPAVRVISPTHARRLALTRQRLAGPWARPNAEGIMEVVRDLGCLQLDPVNVVERSHRLVLWSRLGPYATDQLERLRWDERRLFDYWAHAASIVLTEDYPIHRLMMRTYPSERTIYSRRAADWIKENQGLRRHVVSALRRGGPLRMRDLEDRSDASWRSSGWTNERNVSQMLHFLWFQGKVVVARRTGVERWWDLAGNWLPEWTPKDRLSEQEVVRRAAQRSLRALGLGTTKHIDRHFTVGRYPGLPKVLAALVREGRIERARVEEDGVTWPGDWFVHADDLPALERLKKDDWEPRTTLLSPFDNLIIDRARTERLFGFRYRMEIYVPKSKRQFGPYALPILLGDRLIGQVDTSMDRRRGRLRLNAIHATPDAPAGVRTTRAVARAIEALAAFLGGAEVEVTGPVPERWRRAFG